jgi:DNA-binding protein HU-beta
MKHGSNTCRASSRHGLNPRQPRSLQRSTTALGKEFVMATAQKSAPVTRKAASAAKQAAAPVKKPAPTAKKAAPPVKRAASAKTAPQATITLKQIAAQMAESHNLPKKQAEAVFGDMVALVTRHLKNGDKIRLTGLGILQVRARGARMGRNPATGEVIKIKASKNVAFRPAKELKEAV